MYILHGCFVDVSILSHSKTEIEFFKWNKMNSHLITVLFKLRWIKLMYLKKRSSIISTKIVRQINTHDLSKYSTCMYFSIRCSVYQCTFTMQLMYNYFYTLNILTIYVSNVHLCTSSCSFFLIKSDIGFHYIENNVDESTLYSKHRFF